MGGVLVDKQDGVPLFHDDVGVQHLPGDAPGGCLSLRLRLHRGGDLGRGPLLQGRSRARVWCGRLRRRGGGALRPGPGQEVEVLRRHPVVAGHPALGFTGAGGGRSLPGLPLPGGGHFSRDRSPGAGRLRRGGLGCALPLLGREERGGGGHPGQAGHLPTAVGHVVEGQLPGGQPGLVGGHGVVGPGLLQRHGGADMVPLQGGEDRVVHRAEHPPLAAELHLRLGRVHIHVHRAEPGGQMEDTAGKFAHHLLVLVGLLQGGHHQPGLHLPPIDEEELPVPAGPAAGGLGDEAGHGHALVRAVHLGEAQGQIPAQHRVDGGAQLSVPGGGQLLLSVPEEFHCHLRVGQGHPLDHAEYGGPLGGVLFHELQPGGGVVEQVPHHHGGAQGAARLLHRPGHAPLQGQGGPQRGILGAAHHVDAGDGGNGGQCLPPEPQGADGLQVILRAQLAGGVAEEGGLHLGGRDAAAVIGDPEKSEAAVGDLHGHRSRPRVDGVFHQLLGHAGRPLHHLAGGDQVGNVGI